MKRGFLMNRGLKAIGRFSAPLLCIFALSCADDPRASDRLKVVADFGDSGVILRSELGARLAQSGAARTPPGSARQLVVKRSFEKMVEERLLLIAAKKNNIVVEDWEIEGEIETASADYPPGLFPRTLYAERLTLESYRDLVRQRLMVAKFLRTKMETLPAPTRAELQARFDSTVKGRELPSEARVRQVLVKTEEEAVHVLQEIRSKRITPEKAALQFSEAPEGKSGGDLGWFAKGSMPRVFDICFTKERGAVTDVVESVWGFHIFEIIDTRPAHLETFEEAEDQLYNAIMLERQEATLQKLMTELRSNTPVKINKKALKSVVDAIPPPPEQAPPPSTEIDLPDAEPKIPVPNKAPKVIDISKNKNHAHPKPTATLKKPAPVKKARVSKPNPQPEPKAPVEKKPAVKEPVEGAQKPADKEPAAQKPAAQKPAAQKPAAQKPADKKPAPKKAPPKPEVEPEPKGEPPPPEPKGEPEE